MLITTKMLRTAGARRGSAGFTLIELLTVIAIISLLISILIPSLAKARDQAKNLKSRAALDGISKSLELFRTENEQEFNGYPSSYPRNATNPTYTGDDPTESGIQNISGAQLLVRYLMGKDFNGYVPRKNVPRVLLESPMLGWEQRYWYETEGTPPAGVQFPLNRAGPYLDPGAVKLELPRNLPGGEPIGDHNGSDVTVGPATFEQPVMLDAFGYPILYYTANATRASDPAAPIARVDETRAPIGKGIFSFRDNALWTGVCEGGPTGGTCSFAPWDFIGGGLDNKHWISNFGPNDPPQRMTIADDTKTFAYHIMNKNAYETTDRKSVIPFRRDSFLLISAGKDGLYGSKDDVNNFE